MAGSKKLLPDNPSFYQVLRSGPTSIQVKNIADGTVRTIKKSAVKLVNFSENQEALRLMRENFPKSLLWGFNTFNRKQTTPKYLYHSSQRQTEKEVKKVTFSDKSEVLCLEQLCKLEEEFLSKYLDFSLFPSFLKSHSVIHPTLVQTKFENSRFI